MTFLIRFGVWQVDKWVRCVDYIRQPQVHLKVIIEKSLGEVSLMEQDTIENVS